MDILKKTFEQMPNIFTSNSFNSQAVKNGYPKRLLKNNGLAWFLRKYADNDIERTKTWTKKTSVSIKEKTGKYKFDSIDDVIIFLKTKGYKIMKPVSEWVEC